VADPDPIRRDVDGEALTAAANFVTSGHNIGVFFDSGELRRQAPVQDAGASMSACKITQVTARYLCVDVERKHGYKLACHPQGPS
jgi:hypothetical protein